MLFVAYKGKEIQGKTASSPKEELFKVSVLLTGLLPIARWILFICLLLVMFPVRRRPELELMGQSK